MNNKELPQYRLEPHETLLIQIFGGGDLEFANENLGTALEEKIFYLERNGWKKVLRVALMEEPSPGKVICSHLFLDPWGIQGAEDPEVAWLIARVRRNRLTSGMKMPDVYLMEQLTLLKDKLSSCLIKLLRGQRFSKPITSISGEELIAASRKITATLCGILLGHLPELQPEQFGTFAPEVEKLKALLSAAERDIRANLPEWIRGEKSST